MKKSSSRQKDQEQTDSRKAILEKKSKDKLTKSELIAALSTAISALAILLTVWALSISRSALLEQRQEFRRLNDPLIVIDSIEGVVDTNSVGLTYKMKNIGKTPAFNVRQSQLTYLSFPNDTAMKRKDEIEEWNKNDYPTIIPPDVSLFGEIKHLRFATRKNFIIESIKKKHSLYFVKDITYTDFEGREHYSHYRFEVIFDYDPKMGISTTFKPVGPYNDFK